MNQSLFEFSFHSFADIDLFQKYEICRQQSQCYLLAPPPRPPTFPKLFVNNSSSSSTNYRQHINTCFVFLGIFIVLISTSLLVLFIYKLRSFHKSRRDHRETKATHIVNDPTTFPSIFSTPYNSLTPTTITTNRSPSFIVANKMNLNLQQHSPFDNQSSSIDDKLLLSSNHHHCSCCSCTLTYYQQKQYIHATHQIPLSEIICHTSLPKRLPYKQQCLCHNFFVPIK